MLRRVRREAACGLLELTLAADALASARLVPRHRDVHEALEKVPFERLGGPPGVFERLVRGEVLAPLEQREASLVRRFHDLHGSCMMVRSAAVATILVAGVDIFFRGKLDALLGAKHKLVTTDSAADPDLVIVDIARVDPEEVADEYPDIPILGFTNHTDTAGLRAAHAAGFDQVVVRSALAERAPELVDELVA